LGVDNERHHVIVARQVRVLVRITAAIYATPPADHLAPHSDTQHVEMGESAKTNPIQFDLVVTLCKNSHPNRADRLQLHSHFKSSFAKK